MMMLIHGLFIGIIVLIGLGIISIAFLAIWIPGLYLFKVQRKWRATHFALPILWIVFIGGIIGIGYAFSQPSAVFHSTFQTPPTPNVSNLQSSSFDFGDTRYIYLQFNCPPALVPQLIAATGLPPITPPVSSGFMPRSSSDPVWWIVPPAHASTQYYYSDLTGQTHQGGYGEAWIIYDPITQQLNYQWIHIE